MLVSHHASLSFFAALAAAPLVKNKANLGLFWAAAVGQDVDHYAWHALKYRNASLRDAYRFFRARYGKPRAAVARDDPRALHGFVPLLLAMAASLLDRRLLPIALGMALHGFLDGVHERYLMPVIYGYPLEGGQHRSHPTQSPRREM